MDANDLRRVDLNLLVAFSALMETRSVTRAAEVLGIGQPSASHALKRLRDLLGDPLFVRGSSAMVPTPRALELDEPVRNLLAGISATLFTSASFEPARADRTYRVGATDYAQIAIAEPLLTRLRDQAPSCRLILTATDCDVVGRALERGEIDLAFGAFPRHAWAAHQQHLYDETYACVFDAAACRVTGHITMAQWLALPQLIMSTKGDLTGPLDEVLAVRGVARKVVASTPHFLTIPYLLRGKRLTAALPARLADGCCKPMGLSVCELPFAAPNFAVSMVWSARTANEPGNVWLREQIAAMCDTTAVTAD